MAETVWLSFTDANRIGTGGDYVGLANSTKMLVGNAFQTTRWPSLCFVLASEAIEIVVRVLSALLLTPRF